MAQAPYQPYPTAQPYMRPTPELRIDTPGAAFGTSIGAALQQLGGSVEKDGDELFQRATALQELRNEADARQAQTDYALKAGKLYADYGAQQGKDAIDGFAPYEKSLNDLRTQLRGTLNTQMAQKMFDADSLPFMQRTINEGAGHAARENKEYLVGSASAKYSTDLMGVRQSPDDDLLFQRVLRGGVDKAEQISNIKGEDGPLAQSRKIQAISQAWRGRILGVNDKDPVRAAQMLEEHKDSLDDTDYAQVEATVTSQSRGIASTNLANEALLWGKGDDITPPKTVEQMVDHVKERAAELFPDNPKEQTLVEQHAVTTLHGQVNVQDWEKKKQNWTDTQAVESAILNGKVQNVQQLRAMPEMPDILTRLGPKYENGLPAHINNINAMANQKTREDNFLRIDGLYKNDREEFLNTDLTSQHLSLTDYKYWSAKQQAAKDKVEDDPRVRRAVSILQGSMAQQLNDLGIYRRTDQNKDEFDHFTGAISSALDVWTQDHGKPPTGQEIKDVIGPQLIQQHAKGGFLGMHNAIFGSDVPFYEQDVTTPEAKDWITKKKDEVIGSGGAEPSDAQMYQAWTRYQYLKLYGKKDKPSE